MIDGGGVAAATAPASLEGKPRGDLSRRSNRLQGVKTMHQNVCTRLAVELSRLR